MAKLKGLGRGLDALLAGDDEPRSGEHGGELAISALRPGRYQPRTRMDPNSLEELAGSIRAQGLMQPVLVRPVADGQYEIIAGERRWRAAQLAGLKKLPVIVRDVPDSAALAMALIENIQREDLNPLEEAAGIRRLIDEFSMTHEMAADAVGRSRSAVTNLLRLLTLAKPVQELLMQGGLEMGHARALLAVSGARQIELAQRVVALGLSVRETEQLVGQGAAPHRRAKRSVRKDRDITVLEEELSQTLGATVRIAHGKTGRGRLTIEYASLDQLDEILARLRS
ncbi:MAG: ParB/RepB/Spo0J family partition protein [Burkholderiales bacterium]